MNKRQKKKRKKLEGLYEGWDKISWKSKRKFEKEFKRFCELTKYVEMTEYTDTNHHWVF